MVGINKGAEKKPKPKKAVGVASDATPKVILERNHQVRGEAASYAAVNERRLGQIVSILSLLVDSGVPFKSAPAGWPDNLNGVGRAKAAQLLDKMNYEELSELQRQLTAKVLLEATKFGFGSNGTDTFGSVAEWIAECRKCHSDAGDNSAFSRLQANYVSTTPHRAKSKKAIQRSSGLAPSRRLSASLTAK